MFAWIKISGNRSAIVVAALPQFNESTTIGLKTSCNSTACDRRPPRNHTGWFSISSASLLIFRKSNERRLTGMVAVEPRIHVVCNIPELFDTDSPTCQTLQQEI